MSSRRVVVTGLGIVSSIGNNQSEVVESLREGRSGIEYSEEYAELGFRSHVHGPIHIDLDAEIDRKLKRFMGDGAAFNYIAMRDAIADAGLEAQEVSNERAGLVVGSGGPSTSNIVLAADILREKGVKRVGPYMVTRTMSSTNSACLATPFKIKGVNYSISSACSTSAHCIGHAAELIQMGKQDVVFAGGGEEVHWTMTVLFDAMGALSSKYNDAPETASRPYDATRDGFVISGGGGVLVMEELEHAKARGAKIYAELVRARGRCAACARPWPRWRPPSTTSMPTAPAHRWATSASWRPCGKCSATRCRRWPPPSPSPAMPWAPPASTRPSIPC